MVACCVQAVYSCWTLCRSLSIVCVICWWCWRRAMVSLGRLKSLRLLFHRFSAVICCCYISCKAWPRRNVLCILATAVCVSVCLSLAASPHYCMDPDVTWRNGRGCPVVVHCWVDLQSVHGFHCCDNTHVCKLMALYTANAYSAECEMSAGACTRSVASWIVVLKRLIACPFVQLRLIPYRTKSSASWE